MHELRGTLHDGRSSRAYPAVLEVYTDRTVRLTYGTERNTLAFEDLQIPARLADTVRRIALPSGGVFETPDNDAVDAILAAHASARHGWLHRLESRTGFVVLAAGVVIVGMGLFALRGIPAVARTAAFALPPETNGRLAQGTLDLLDQTLTPSELPEPRREELRNGFRAIAAAAAAEEYAFRLEFRSGGALGANAVALPSGTVVVTDELVALAEDDRELWAVLAHEAGHVVHRHGLRQAIQDSLFLVVLVLIAGDVGSATSLVAALPTALAEARFSRQFEREADDHARAYLEFHGHDPAHLARLLLRMEEDQDDDFALSFLATHPATDERIARLLDENP